MKIQLMNPKSEDKTVYFKDVPILNCFRWRNNNCPERVYLKVDCCSAVVIAVTDCEDKSIGKMFSFEDNETERVVPLETELNVYLDEANNTTYYVAEDYKGIFNEALGEE